MWGQNSMNFNDIQRLLGVLGSGTVRYFQFSGHISHHSSWPRSKKNGEHHVFLLFLESQEPMIIQVVVNQQKTSFFRVKFPLLETLDVFLTQQPPVDLLFVSFPHVSPLAHPKVLTPN